MTWLSETIIVTERDPKQQKEIDDLRAEVKKMKRDQEDAKGELLGLPPAQLEAFKDFVRYLEERKKKAVPSLMEQIEGKDNSSKAEGSQ